MRYRCLGVRNTKKNFSGTDKDAKKNYRFVEEENWRATLPFETTEDGRGTSHRNATLADTLTASGAGLERTGTLFLVIFPIFVVELVLIAEVALKRGIVVPARKMRSI